MTFLFCPDWGLGSSGGGGTKGWEIEKSGFSSYKDTSLTGVGSHFYDLT